MSAPKHTAAVLSEAADLLSRPGAWTQESWFRTKTGKATHRPGNATCMCAEGALAIAARVHPSDVYKHPAACALARLIPSTFTDIPDWNDAPGRTQAEVVAALREAAKATGESS